MRRVSLQYIEVRNFKSFASARMELPREPGLRLVFGENRREPTLGANGCLSGNTLIDCPRDIGKYPRGIPIRRLLGKQFYTYSWDEDNQDLVLSWVSKVWRTGYREVYRVSLTPYPQAQKRLGNRKGGISNNKFLPPCELVGTYDHPILLCDGTWKKLGDLIPGDSLKSLYRSSGDGRGKLRWSGREPTIITRVGWQKNTVPTSYYSLVDGVSEHQFVCEAINGPRPNGAHAHHMDENSLNHSPDNLEWKDAFKHLSEHTSKWNREGKTGWQASRVHPRGFLGKTHSIEARTAIGEASSRRHEDRRSRINHRVDGIPEKVGTEWVYDMRVERTHNFVANGVFVHNSGKSTLVADAPCFCLHGRSAGRRTNPGGKRASELVATGEKKMYVETGWLIDDVLRTIRRTFPPERVYVDGELSDQVAVDELMGLSRDRFLASVVFGQDRPLFVDLPVPERGDLLDEVLGLGFWMRAADLASSRWSTAGVESQKIDREVARLEGALAEVPDEAGLEEAIREFEEGRGREITELREKRRALDREYRALRRSMSATRAAADEERAAYALLGELREQLTEGSSDLAVLEAEVERLAEGLSFFSDNQECPTCGQEITDEVADEHVSRMGAEHSAKYDELVSKQPALDALKGQVSATADRAREMGNKARDYSKSSLAATSKKSEVGIVDNRISLISGEINPHETTRQVAAARRVELENQLAAKRSEAAVLSARIDQLDFWRQGFRRVRMFCLRRVLAELEPETISEARRLGLLGWSIGYTGETETKAGTVRLGVRAVVQSPEATRDFDSWSPGEGQRVRCATALGLASLVQRYSGVSYDLEVWDEPSAWLSAEGVDDLFECLADRARERGKSVWVVDPRAGLSHGGFDGVWNVIKTEDGSRVEIIR